MIILITGVPGTGKGTISAELKQLGFSVISVNSLVDQLHLWTNIEMGSRVVDLNALRRELLKIINLSRHFNIDIVIEGHLICEIKLPADICIVLRTDPRILIKRLSKRNYPAYKLEENIEAECLDYCTQLAERKLKGECKVYEVDTSNPIKSSIHDVSMIIDGKGKKFLSGWVDWSEETDSVLKQTNRY